MINTVQEFWKYIELLSIEADYLVVMDKSGTPWILVESDYGDIWAQRFPNEDDTRTYPGQYLVAGSSGLSVVFTQKLPLTVLYTPGSFRKVAYVNSNFDD